MKLSWKQLFLLWDPPLLATFAVSRLIKPKQARQAEKRKLEQINWPIKMTFLNMWGRASLPVYLIASSADIYCKGGDI